MKRIVQEFSSRTILLPNKAELSEISFNPFATENEAGLFPDRLVFKAETGDFDKLVDLQEKLVKEIGKNVAEHLGIVNQQERDNVIDFFKNYIKIYFAEFELPEKTPYNNVIDIAYEYLNTLELQAKFVPEEKENINNFGTYNKRKINYLVAFLNTATLENNKLQNYSFLFNDAFPKERKRYESLFEISAKELIDTLSEQQKTNLDLESDEQDAVCEALKKFFSVEKQKNNEIPKAFHTYHKYIAIVQADGDNFGEINKNLSDAEVISFSKDLTSFSKFALDGIKAYGATPVYIGGDDLLFFAPIQNEGRNIFELIAELDKVFNEKLGNYTPKPTLSFGVSISYYKYPLYEALNQARELLFDKAKKFETKAGIKKNALSFRVLTHSGKYFGANFNKDSDIYSTFKGLIKANIDNQSFLNSVPQKLLANEALIRKIGVEKTSFVNYVDNHFNEKVHETESNKLFLYNVKKLLELAFQHYPEKDAVNIIYSGLRLVKFLNRLDNE